jgi:hypothetical protein
MSSTHDLFIDFASFGAGRQTLQQMDGRSFAKLCRDCRLIDRALTLIDVDILFTKVKVRALVPCGMCGVQIGARGSLPHPLPLSPWHVCRCTAVSPRVKCVWLNVAWPMGEDEDAEDYGLFVVEKRVEGWSVGGRCPRPTHGIGPVGEGTMGSIHRLAKRYLISTT